jgi:hypothetical protein
VVGLGVLLRRVVLGRVEQHRCVATLHVVPRSEFNKIADVLVVTFLTELSKVHICLIDTRGGEYFPSLWTRK